MRWSAPRRTRPSTSPRLTPSARSCACVTTPCWPATNAAMHTSVLALFPSTRRIRRQCRWVAPRRGEGSRRLRGLGARWEDLVAEGFGGGAAFHGGGDEEREGGVFGGSDTA